MNDLNNFKLIAKLTFIKH